MLSDPKNDTPVFKESVTFNELEPEHRKSLIHGWEARLEQGDELPVRGNWLRIALRSDYDFDRIAAYLYQEKRLLSEFAADLQSVHREFERRRIQPKGTYMPLHYSLRALSAVPDIRNKRKEIERELNVIGQFLTDTVHKPETDPLFSAIQRVRAALQPGQVLDAKMSRGRVHLRQ